MKPEIAYEDFEKLDLRIAEIENVEEIPDKDKLLKLSLSLGDEKRTIVAGVKPYYKKEELIGKQIVMIANLAPRKLGGILSEGMLLAAGSTKEKICILLQPEKNTEPGSKIN